MEAGLESATQPYDLIRVSVGSPFIHLNVHSALRKLLNSFLTTCLLQIIKLAWLFVPRFIFLSSLAGHNTTLDSGVGKGIQFECELFKYDNIVPTFNISWSCVFLFSICIIYVEYFYLGSYSTYLDSREFFCRISTNRSF